MYSEQTHTICMKFSSLRAMALALGLFWAGTAARADIEISEFLAANQTGLKDSDGAFSDWIEIRNTGAAAVNLLGWTLTDDPTNKAKWAFPGVILNPGQYLVVFASGKDRRTVGTPLHTNFSLDSTGEYLGLFAPESTQAESEFAPAYPPQKSDISFGPRAGRNYFYTPPSPGVANVGGFGDFVADTKFSQDRGFYDSPFTLTISSATAGAVIRYTLDGTVPTLTSGLTYGSPLSISKTTVIRAAAFKEGLQPSNVDTHTYVFLDDVLKQSPDGKAPAGWPATWGANTVDYGMDPDVVNSALYKGTIKNDMKTLPSFCVTVRLPDLFDSATGIYANPGQDGRAWERPCSLELVYPDGTKGFQINAGIRVRGGFSRSTSNPKHALRFFFRDQYGAGKLKYPLFGDRGTDTFDGVDLRTFQNYSWSFQGDGSGVFMRDQFSRDTQLAMGHLGERGDYYHLYINGHYWGLYNTCERPEASYGETYLGGNKEDYDTIKVEAGPYTVGATDGTMEGWNQLYQICKTVPITDETYYRLQGMNLDGTVNAAYPPYLDIDNLIDYMLVIIYGGNLDAPISNFLGNSSPNNWYGLWDRTGKHGGFRFFAHDAEHTLLNVNENRTGPYSAGNSSVTKSSPQWIWQQLASNAEFRLRVGDRVHRHFFNGGVLTPASARARFLERKAQIDRAVVGESARWGDSKVGTPYTRDNAWLPAVNGILNNYLPQRSAIVLNQLRNYQAGGQAQELYPALAAPAFSQFGGVVPKGYALGMTVPQGQIYYTTDGTDPRLRGGGLAGSAKLYSTSVVVDEAVRVRTRARNGASWSALTEAVFTVAQDFSKLRVTEIHYNPTAFGGVDGDEFEFLELKNTGATDLDLSQLRFSSGVDFQFPIGTKLAAGKLAVLGSNPTEFAKRYPGIKLIGGYQGRLANAGERITLVDAAGASVLDFEFSDIAPWPVAADGSGFSLVPIQPNPTGDAGLASGWRASAAVNGSPGTDDPVVSIPPVVINEILTHTDPPLADSIELYNAGNTVAEVGGWWLSDDWNTPRKYRIPAGKRIDPKAWLVLTESEFNHPQNGTNRFSLSSHGDELILSSANAAGDLTGYVDAIQFPAAPNGVSFGRVTNSVGEVQFALMAQRTLGALNGVVIAPAVVLNEILYAPLPGDVEFLEVRNVSGAPVTLFDPLVPTNTWRLNGLDFQFPPNVTLPPGGLAVISSGDPATFRSLFSVPADVPVFGPFNGSLQDGGEFVELQRPDSPDRVTNGVVVTTVVPYITVDAVRYDNREPWPAAAAGGGASLERRTPVTYGNDPASWQASALFPSPGAANDSNRAPRVNAGSDTDVVSQTYPHPVVLAGTGLDDGRPNPPGKLTYLWSQLGGAPGVVFADPTSKDTTALLPGQGTYVLGLTVSDGERSSQDEVLVTARRQEGPATFVPFGATWRYLDTGPDPGTAWRAPNFVDGSWLTGPAQFGYSNDEGDEATVLNFGGDSGNKRIAYYFRLAFDLPNAAAVTELTGRLVRDDGAVGYLNGQPAFRDNMPEGEPNLNTRANSAVGGADESNPFDHPIDTGLLVSGRNVLAIEIHQSGPTSSDVSFDFSLVGRTLASNLAPKVNAGPDLTVTLPESLGITATFTDDGLPQSPGVPAFGWTRVSGPGAVVFASPNSPRTQASFTVAGNYVLRFTANDGASSASDDIAVVVKPGVAPVAPTLGILAGPPTRLQIGTVPGQTYTVQSTSSLDVPQWKSVATLPAGAGGVLEVVLDTGDGASRLYRVVTPAQP